MRANHYKTRTPREDRLILELLRLKAQGELKTIDIVRRTGRDEKVIKKIAKQYGMEWKR